MLETLGFLGKPFCHDILYIVPYWPFFEMGGLPWTSNPPVSSYRVADISGMRHSVGVMWWWGEPITLCIIRGWHSAKSPACPAPDIFDFFEIFLQLYYEGFRPIIYNFFQFVVLWCWAYAGFLKHVSAVPASLSAWENMNTAASLFKSWAACILHIFVM